MIRYLTMLALPTFLCAACQTNTIELEFLTDNADDSGGSAGTADDDDDDVMPGVEGQWLLAIDSVLGPGLPFQFLVTAEASEADVYTITMQSLSLDVGSSTTPRQLVGEPHVYFGVPLPPGADLGLFTGEILIPGVANPVTGTDVFVDMLLSGGAVGDPFCGMVTGAVTQPQVLDLAGSTFGTVKVTGPDALPATFPASCG